LALTDLLDGEEVDEMEEREGGIRNLRKDTSPTF
jgi:hypothetical protein